MNFAMTVYNGASSIGEDLVAPAFLDVDSVNNSDVLTYPFGRASPKQVLITIPHGTQVAVCRPRHEGGQ